MHNCVANFPRPAVPSQMQAPMSGGSISREIRPPFPICLVMQSQEQQCHGLYLGNKRRKNRSEGSLVHFLLTKFNLRDFLGWLGGHWCLILKI